MVGPILSRVLSRTRLSSVKRSSQELDKKRDCASEQDSTMSMTSILNDRTKQIATMEKQSSTSFEVTLKGPSPSGAISHANPRKQSYASIKEDPELPQSFTSRRLPYDTNSCTQRRRSSLASHNLELNADKLEDVLDTLGAHESALLESEDEEEVEVEAAAEDEADLAPAQSHAYAVLETLPDEILDHIFSLLTAKADKDRLADPKVDLFNLLFVSRSVHAAALRVAYRHVRMPQSKAFFKFHNALAMDSRLGSLVQNLDFSHYSSIGFGRARSTTIEKPYLTPRTLTACLDTMTNLKSLLAHEHIDDELDTAVLTKLLNMSSLRALDLCACSSEPFTKSFSYVSSQLSTFLSIERLSLHECTVLRPQVFEAILPRLNRLTHLDVAHTMINDKALMSIPSTARITHLNLERCNQITGRKVVEFLTSHPAVTESLVFLDLMADASRYRLLDEDELSTLLPVLPSTLRSLNLGGARINSSHTCMLRKLATHLEELGLKGANLSLSADIMHILSQVSIDCDEELQNPDWRHSLRYLDLTDVRSVNQMSLSYSPMPITRIETMPLEVIELGESVIKDITKRIKNVKDSDWVVQELGRRGWYVRQARLVTEANGRPEDGYRYWKMGVRWWGMRKLPMIDQATGGMYGYYMFKRA